jgi:hypothetical protein
MTEEEMEMEVENCHMLITSLLNEGAVIKTKSGSLAAIIPIPNLAGFHPSQAFNLILDLGEGDKANL